MKCQECGTEIGKKKKCSCGWEASEAEEKKKNRRCQHRYENGYQCNKEGVVSPNIRGDGPWFCCCAHGRLNGFF